MPKSRAKIMLSGGAGNSNASASLGGAASTSEVKGATATPSSLFSGQVTVLNVVGVEAGQVKVSKTYSSIVVEVVETGEISASTSTSGLVGDTLFFDDTGTKYIELSWDSAWGQGNTVEDDLFTVASIPVNLFSTISASDVDNATPIYRCIHVKADSSLTYPKVFTPSALLADDSIEVALGAVAANTAAVVIDDQYDSTNKLSAVNFQQAKTYHGGLALPVTMEAGQTYAVWVKYTPSNARFSTNKDQTVPLLVGYLL